MKAWLANDVLGDVDVLLSSPTWCVQVKEDGNRLQVRVPEVGPVEATNREGNPTKLPPVIAKALAGRLVRPLHLDGEWKPTADLGRGLYVLYDLLEIGPTSLVELPYQTRWETLEALYRRTMNHPPFRLVESAFDEEAKRELRARAQRTFHEGVIFKNLDSPYITVRPIEGGTCLREKFWKTADVVVMRRPLTHPDQRRSFEMFAYDNDGEPVHLGSVNSSTRVPGARGQFHEQLEPGQSAVAEVRYLYMSPGMNLVQPTLLRLRDDKRPEQCVTGQLRKGGRFRESAA